MVTSTNKETAPAAKRFNMYFNIMIDHCLSVRLCKKAMPAYFLQQHRFITVFLFILFRTKKESDVKNYTYIRFKSQVKAIDFYGIPFIIWIKTAVLPGDSSIRLRIIPPAAKDH